MVVSKINLSITGIYVYCCLHAQRNISALQTHRQNVSLQPLRAPVEVSDSLFRALYLIFSIHIMRNQIVLAEIKELIVLYYNFNLLIKIRY